MSRRPFPINPPYPPPPDPVPDPGPGPDDTVPVSPVEDEALRRMRDAEERIDRMFDSVLGKVFLMVCGIIAILLVISIGVAALAGIWRFII